MSNEILNALNEFGEKQGRAWEEYKKANDSRLEKVEKSQGSALDTEKVQKINDDLDRFDEKMEAMRRKLAAADLYGGKKDVDEKKDLYRKAWWSALKSKVSNKPIDEATLEVLKDNAPDYLKETYHTDGSTVGAEWAPEDYIQELWRDVTEVSPVVGLVRNYPTTRKAIEIPTHTELDEAKWASGAAAAPRPTREASTLSHSGLVSIVVHELYSKFEASREALDDVVLGMENIIRDDQALQIAQALGKAIIEGTGTGQPTGLDDAGETVNAAGETFDADDIIKMYYDIKTSYAESGTWLTNRTNLQTIRSMKVSAGADSQYLWVPGFGAGANTLLGRPIVECKDCQDMSSAATHAVIFGDFRRAYALATNRGFRTLVDPYSGASTGTTSIYGYTRVGGQTIKGEAYTRLIGGS